MFKEYKGLDLTGLSAEVLESWKKQDVFHKTLEMREGAPEYVFFEGPPLPYLQKALSTLTDADYWN